MGSVCCNKNQHPPLYTFRAAVVLVCGLLLHVPQVESFLSNFLATVFLCVIAYIVVNDFGKKMWAFALMIFSTLTVLLFLPSIIEQNEYLSSVAISLALVTTILLLFFNTEQKSRQKLLLRLFRVNSYQFPSIQKIIVLSVTLNSVLTLAHIIFPLSDIYFNALDDALLTLGIFNLGLVVNKTNLQSVKSSNKLIQFFTTTCYCACIVSASVQGLISSSYIVGLKIFCINSILACPCVFFTIPPILN